jgi:hypothetical protein
MKINSESPLPTNPMEEEWLRKYGMRIVDYVLDETTMSLNLEGGEIVSTRQVVYGQEI